MAEETIEDRLRTLPLRAIVAFAARCARRVELLGRSLVVLDRSAIHNAIEIAEVFARGEIGKFAAVGAADAATARAARAADAALTVGSADDAASYSARAAAAAGAASYAAYGAARATARSDIQQLVALHLGQPGELGNPIDPSEAGPLGPLWPERAPDWYFNPPISIPEGSPGPEPSIPEGSPGPEPAPLEVSPPSLVIVWDPDVLNAKDYAELVATLGDLVRAEGGLGVERLRSRGFCVPIEVGVCP
jgi:hypothetical protein